MTRDKQIADILFDDYAAEKLGELLNGFDELRAALEAVTAFMEGMELRTPFQEEWTAMAANNRRLLKRLPESEGQSSEAITSTETSECPARQSGSPEVDPSGERQVCGMDLGKGIKCSGPKDHPPGIHQYEVDFL